jgi:CxxC motif-containing protein (DUF1111 family)
MKKWYVIFALVSFVSIFSMCNKASTFPDSGYDERLSGGAATVFDASSSAFSNPIEGLSDRDLSVHLSGDATFGQTFVAPPSIIFTGLGPIYNNISCVNCHRNDGEGIPTVGSSNSGLLMRISLPNVVDQYGGQVAVPGFGLQIQDQALLGVQPEAKTIINYTNVTVNYPDGNSVTLRQPTYTVQNSYIPIPAGCVYSPRLAPPLIGMGLLGAIDESTILSFVDANDANGDGITGKANYVYDIYTKKIQLGRFGLKANTASLLTQVATAYQQDMGVTSYVQPQESAFGQTQMDNVSGDIPIELVDSLLNYVTYYVKSLAVPARRNVKDPTVQRGEYLFSQINCSGCHKQTVTTGIDLSLPQISNQRIHPYTDMLLHDMGTGLADNRPDYLATGNDWRTPALWGIGLLPIANGTPYYLHDGRARTVEEAILWHGGEAQRSRDSFTQLSFTDRNALLTFINSL